MNEGAKRDAGRKKHGKPTPHVGKQQLPTPAATPKKTSKAKQASSTKPASSATKSTTQKSTPKAKAAPKASPKTVGKASGAAGKNAGGKKAAVKTSSPKKAVSTTTGSAKKTGKQPAKSPPAQADKPLFPSIGNKEAETLASKMKESQPASPETATGSNTPATVQGGSKEDEDSIQVAPPVTVHVASGDGKASSTNHPSSPPSPTLLQTELNPNQTR